MILLWGFHQPTEGHMAKNGDTDDLDIPALIQQQREKLLKRREDTLSRQAELQKELDAINSELKRADLYLNPDAVKEEKKPRQQRQPREGGQRAPRGEIRGKVLEAIREAGPDGISRADLLEKFGVKGDKSGEQKISNATNALRKAGQVDNRNGQWIAA